jgi:dATP pyrophosphohydrolase
MMPYKLPHSIQVVIYNPRLNPRCYLLLRRVAPQGGFWQTVTGSLEMNESHLAAAVREVNEETGIVCREIDLLDLHLTNVFAIAPQWRSKFAPEVTHNEEVCYALTVEQSEIRLDQTEHEAYDWVDYDTALEMLYWESSKKALAKAREMSDQIFVRDNF